MVLFLVFYYLSFIDCSEDEVQFKSHAFLTIAHYIFHDHFVFAEKDYDFKVNFWQAIRYRPNELLSIGS